MRGRVRANQVTARIELSQLPAREKPAATDETRRHETPGAPAEALEAIGDSRVIRFTAIVERQRERLGCIGQPLQRREMLFELNQRQLVAIRRRRAESA